MGFAKLKAVNTFCDKVKPEEEDQSRSPGTWLDQLWGDGKLRTGDKTESEGGQRNLNKVIFSQQVHICLEELENNFNEAALDTVFAHCENNQMLSRLQKMWQDVVAWVQEKWASFVSVVKSIWIDIKDFCSRVAQYFSS
ncbi:hypothetical protein D623_10002373 [Myotis brandtii]|uniref:Uncharacterized protein n=1 Tax=Myotis brandtii TaxID=109478 RepID=S7MR65_MYOBR|nr:hypothetical protein D623_10002373 [Myotis brandtii]